MQFIKVKDRIYRYNETNMAEPSPITIALMTPGDMVNAFIHFCR